MSDAPTEALKDAKKSSKVAINPKYTVTKHGMLNIAEVVRTIYAGAAVASVVCVLLSGSEQTASRVTLMVSFAFAYVSSVMLLGGISSPYTQAYLPLSLYFLLYHLVGSGFFLITSGWLLSVAKEEVLDKVAAGLGLGSGVVHFLHGLYTFATVFNQPVAKSAGGHCVQVPSMTKTEPTEDEAIKKLPPEVQLQAEAELGETARVMRDSVVRLRQLIN
ncbi:hypothetical protein HPB47_011999, partial [Ixodes persulcatus]